LGASCAALFVPPTPTICNRSFVVRATRIVGRVALDRIDSGRMSRAVYYARREIEAGESRSFVIIGCIIETHSDEVNSTASPTVLRQRWSPVQPGCAERKLKVNPKEMICKNCGGKTDVHLIDCCAPFNTPERSRRYCPSCRPEYNSRGQRRFVVDRLASYPIAERLIDLQGSCPPKVM
jgi:hypothetical protein